MIADLKNKNKTHWMSKSESILFFEWKLIDVLPW